MAPSNLNSIRHRALRARWLVLWLSLAAPCCALAQAAASAAVEPIYWRQNLLTVPYQWTSDDGPQNGTKVSLYVSKDRGATWQVVGEAQPQLLAFNYHAEADGEYWFSIRTSEAGGTMRLPPIEDSSSMMQPELRVIVDTTMPRIESLSAQLRPDGILKARWRVADPHLSTHSCHVEVQAADTGNWQPMPLTAATEVSPGVWEGVATFVVTTSGDPTTVRATAVDLAGNRSVFQASVTPIDDADSFADGAALAPVKSLAGDPGWTSNSAPPLENTPQPALPQLWAADRIADAPLAYTHEHTAQVLYGTPIATDAAQDSGVGSTDDRLQFPQPTIDDRPLGNLPQHTARDAEPASPFRQVSLGNERAMTDVAPPALPVDAPQPASPPLSRRVNSRTFALEYELAVVGGSGVAKVEVWGTRDGGQYWSRYAVDDDNRSPVDVTVDDEGEYGFAIVVTSADGAATSPPQSGDAPALRVTVDLQPPLAQIISVDAKRGDIEGELHIRWQADDDNLQPLPISLYYSSRPAGPWTPIAADLDNSGEFRWPLERYVPRKIFLKLEARDTAGNVAEFQTAEAVVVELEPAATNWLRLPPVK